MVPQRNIIASDTNAYRYITDLIFYPVKIQTYIHVYIAIKMNVFPPPPPKEKEHSCNLSIQLIIVHDLYTMIFNHAGFDSKILK